jgi:hypothetical protein
MMFSSKYTSFALGLGLLAACSDQSSDLAGLPSDVLRLKEIYGNGTVANGMKANGMKANGMKANGMKANGNTINSPQAALDSNRPTLVGYEIETGLSMKGADFVGSQITARYTNGVTDTVLIEAYDGTTVPGVDLYKIKSLTDNQYICGEKNGDPIWATPMMNVFNLDTGAEAPDDPALFTFACRFGALEKCNEYGYSKWLSGIEKLGGTTKVRKFEDYHAACVRLVRGDYCGDGVGHTFDGTTIDLYDHLENNQQMATATDGTGGWFYEASWGPDGAHCINKTRWMPNALTTLSQNQSGANPDWQYILDHCPQRIAGRGDSDRACGASANWLTTNGFDLFGANTRQNGRDLLRVNTQLYRY